PWATFAQPRPVCTRPATTNTARAQDGVRATSLEKSDANTALHTRRDETFGADERARSRGPGNWIACRDAAGSLHCIAGPLRRIPSRRPYETLRLQRRGSRDARLRISLRGSSYRRDDRHRARRFRAHLDRNLPLARRPVACRIHAVRHLRCESIL